MPLPCFVAYTTAGFAIWYGFLAAVGFGGAEFIGAFAIASNVFGVLLLLAAGGLGAKLALTRRRAAPDGN
jgi:membrane protein DedA with SNARE-associated domain